MLARWEAGGTACQVWDLSHARPDQDKSPQSEPVGSAAGVRHGRLQLTLLNRKPMTCFPEISEL